MTPLETVSTVNVWDLFWSSFYFGLACLAAWFVLANLGGPRRPR